MYAKVLLKAFKLKAFKLKALKLKAFKLKAFKLKAFKLKAFKLKAFKQPQETFHCLKERISVTFVLESSCCCLTLIYQ